MTNNFDFNEIMNKFINESRKYKSREQSWNHCYEKFQEVRKNYATYEAIPSDLRKNLCLNLAFYLASWGMYRGSSFLLEFDYTVHDEIIKILWKKEYANLWTAKIEIIEAKQVADICKEIFQAYKEEKKKRDGYKTLPKTTLTLISKILIGTMACLPAYDRFFIDGLKKYNNYYKQIFTQTNFDDFFYRKYDVSNKLEKLVNELKSFWNTLQSSSEKLKFSQPEMKLIDMYFWTLGNSKLQ